MSRSIQVKMIVFLGLIALGSSSNLLASDVCRVFGNGVCIENGSDYLTTGPGTVFMGVPFMGVPLGGSLGNTDTIVQRLSDGAGTFGTNTTIPIQLSMLQLESTVPANFGLGVGNYFITLQSNRGGPASLGNMTVGINGTGTGGTFSSFFDVFFDVRFGSLSGPIAQSGDLTLTNSGATWSTTPLSGDFLVTGADTDTIPKSAAELNANLHTGLDSGEVDFFITSGVTESSGGDTHVVGPTTVPEPASLILLGFGLLPGVGFEILRRRIARKA